MTRRRLPLILNRLEHAAANWGFFAGDFEFIDDGAARALAWFDGRTRAASAFLAFGQESSGGLYALWLSKRGEAAHAPVVVLGSEGDVHVIASTPHEFLALLALDLDGVGVLNEQARAPGHRRLLAWLKNHDVPPAREAESVGAAARLTHPGLTAVVARAMRENRAPWRPRKASKRPVPVDSLPADPIAMLNRPRPTRLAKDVQVRVGDEGLVDTVFIARGKSGSKFRPKGLDLLAMTRAEIVAKLGRVTKSGSEWDRFDRGDVAIHVQFRSGEVFMVSLMWVPRLPAHLR